MTLAVVTLDDVGGGLFINASLSVIADPVAPFIRGQVMPELDPQPNDTDGDGLSDANEGAMGGDPNNWDTDGDGLSDAREALVTMTSLSLSDTDGDDVSDWLEVNLRTSDPTVNDEVRLPDVTISLVAHELGHILGLPDLYGDKRYFPQRPYARWGLMASDNLQNFGAFSRSVQDWHEPAFGERVINIGPAGLGPSSWVLVEPQRGLVGGNNPQAVAEIIRVQRPFYPDLMIEARPKLLNDATRSAIGYGRGGGVVGLPGSYQSGVLLSQIDPRYETSGSDVRIVFGEPIAEVVPYLGGADPSPDRRSFTVLKGEVEGPGRLMVRLAVNQGESRIDIDVGGVTVDSIDVTLNAMDEVVFTNFFVPLNTGVHQVTIRHSMPFDVTGENEGRADLGSLVLQTAPRIVRQPETTTAAVGVTVEIPIGIGTDNPEGLSVIWQRETGPGIWSNVTGPGGMVDRLRLTNIGVVAAGRYRVQVADGFGLVYSDPFSVYVLDPATDTVAITLGTPSIDWTMSSLLHPWESLLGQTTVRSPTSLPQNLPLSLTASLEGPALLRFDWLEQGGEFEYFVNEVLTASAIGSVTESEETMLGPGEHLLRWTFTKLLTSDVGSVGPVQVLRTPVIVAQPRATAAAAGGFAFFEVGVSPTVTGETTYQWFKDGVAIGGAVNARLNLLTAAASDVGDYFVRVGSVAGLPAVDSNSVRLVVKPDAADDLVGSFLNTVRMERWSQSTNHRGWVPGDSRIVSELDSPVLRNAPILAGETYTDDKGLEIQVGDFDAAAGTFDLTIRSDPPPVFSDLTITYSWLDNPANGFGTFLLGTGGINNDPLFGGDPVFVRRRPYIDFFGPVPFVNFQVITSSHNVSFRVRNAGLGSADDIEGSIFFIQPHIFIGPLLIDGTSLSRVRLNELAFGQTEVSIDSLNAGESTVVTASVVPDGPFQAVLLLDRVENESIFNNNSHHAIFWMEFTSFGSPYEPVELEIDFENVNPFKHHMYPRIAGLPNNWSASITDPVTGSAKQFVQLEPGEREGFQVRVSPPEADVAKPGVAVEVKVEGWMDLADTYVPIGEIPVVVVLTHPTELELQVKVDQAAATLSGRLRYIALAEGGESGASTPLTGELVSIEVVGSDGSVQILPVTTGDSGGFAATAESVPGVQYIGIAYYDGASEYRPAESKSLEWGELGKVVFTGLELSRNILPENANNGFKIGELKPQGGESPVEYSLVSGPGDAGNDRFKLDGNILIATESVDFETDPRLSVRLRVSSLVSNAFLERAFEIVVTDDTSEDADGDGLSQKTEENAGTSDLREDSDGDGYGDGLEQEQGFDPTLEESVPIPYWQERRRITFKNPIAARWSAFDDQIYVGRRNIEGEDGLYRIGKDGANRQIASGDRLAGLVIVPDQRSVYFSEDFSGTIYRVEIPVTGRNPLPGEAAKLWVSTFHDGDDDPIGMALAGPGLRKGPLITGQVVVADRGFNGPAELWTFNPRKSTSEQVLHKDNDTLRAPVDVAVGRDAVYVIDEEAPISRLRLFSVGGRGSLASVPHFALAGNGKAVVVDPVSQELLVMMDEGDFSRIHRLNPITGARSVELDGFSTNPGRSCLGLSLDGQMLIVTDHSADTVIVYERVYVPSPVIEGFVPEFAERGDVIRVNGQGLQAITDVWVGDAVQPIRKGASFNQLEFTLSSNSEGGRVRVASIAGEAESERFLRVPSAPTGISLTDQSVALTQAVDALIGRFVVEDPDVGDLFLIELLPVAGFPDNDWYRIEGANLILGQPLAVNQLYQHRIGVRATDQFGLSVSQAFDIAIHAPPQILSQPESALVADGETVLFEVAVTGSAPLSVQWFLNGKPVPGATQLQFKALASSSLTGEYRVEAINAFGRVFSETATISLRSTLESIRIETIGLDAKGTVSLGLRIEGEGEQVLGLEWSRDFEKWELLEERPFLPGNQAWRFPMLKGETRANFRIVSRP